MAEHARRGQREPVPGAYGGPGHAVSGGRLQKTLRASHAAITVHDVACVVDRTRDVQIIGWKIPNNAWQTSILAFDTADRLGIYVLLFSVCVSYVSISYVLLS